MNLNNLREDDQDYILNDTLNHWLTSAAQMMTCLTVMRALELVDEEEQTYLMNQIGAVTRIGAHALKATANTSLETFMEGAMAINIKLGGKLGVVLEQYAKDILDKPDAP